MHTHEWEDSHETCTYRGQKSHVEVNSALPSSRFLRTGHQDCSQVPIPDTL